MDCSLQGCRKGRALALAGGFAWSLCVFAQETGPQPAAPQVPLERVLQMLERIETEQRALRQEMEAPRTRPTPPPEPAPDSAELEDAADPTALSEAGETPAVPAESPQIQRILDDLARLEAGQQALRQAVERLQTRQDEVTAAEPEGPTPGAEDPASSTAQDQPVAPEGSIPVEVDAGVPASTLGQAEGELPPGDDLEADAEAVLPDTEPVYSPSPYRPAERLYEQGREAFRSLNFYDAAKAFREFLVKYPAHKDAGEARYWLGETLYVEGRFQEAIAAFAEVIADEANPRRQVARLKTGYAWFEVGEFERAEAVLVQVLDQNPDSDLARLAQLRLDRLKRRADGE